MTKHWIYILQCQGDHLYVGETTRLFRRLLEHVHSQGGVNTRTFKPLFLKALYLVENNRIDKSDEKNDEKNKKVLPHHDIENLITEMCMLKNPERWFMVHGGKYTRQSMKVNTIISSYQNNKRERQTEIENRPFCHCGMPCEKCVNTFHGYIVYKCSLHNVWSQMERFLKKLKSEFNVSYEPCDYYYKELHGPNKKDSLGNISDILEHIKNVENNLADKEMEEKEMITKSFKYRFISDDELMNR